MTDATRIETRVWKALGALTALLAIVIPLLVNYSLFRQGPDAERAIELGSTIRTNAMSDLRRLGEEAILSLTVADEQVNNLVLARSSFRNVGRIPIVPSDYHENLSITVEEPWRMLAVRSSDSASKVQIQWVRISDTRFEASPALLNPGDEVEVLIYLTNRDEQELPLVLSDKNLPIKWHARITNMKSFQKRTTPTLFPRGLVIAHAGWAIPFLVLCASVFFAFYSLALSRLGYIRKVDAVGTLSLVLFAILSYSAAEVVTHWTFGFPSIIFSLWRWPNHWINWAILLIHWGCFGYLGYKLMVTQPSATNSLQSELQVGQLPNSN